ncbi:MAG: hypothetical protein IK096_07755, partial [Lachnospiraceae bacterium]|nr:hypothetical protein [Lachnospiraceae bacterium]
GFSPLVAYKLTAALFSVLLAWSCKYSFRLICGRWEPALAGAALFSLSQFVLADLIVRAGFSSYLSYPFLPLLAAGLYDHLFRDGRHARLIGIALSGLLLTHTLNTFLAILCCVLIFALSLITCEGRLALTDLTRWKRLGITALWSLLITAWYWMPLLEQMTGGTDFVYRHPWADVGEFTQSWTDFFDLTGYFFNVAYVGIGVPILLFLAVRLFLNRPQDGRSRFGDLCYFFGLALLAAMTDLLPWRALAHTPLGQLQFTFRIYPFALLFLITGLVIFFDRLLPEDLPGQPAGPRKGSILPLMIAAIALSCIFGIIQNRTATTNPEGFHAISEGTLTEYSGTVGRGEWLPYSYDMEAERLDEVRVGDPTGSSLPYQRAASVPGGSFAISDEHTGDSFIIPHIYYKGYRAKLLTEDGTSISLPVREASNGLLAVSGDGSHAGTVTVSYRRTLCQMLSLLLSIAAGTGLIVRKVLSARVFTQGRRSHLQNQKKDL